MALAWRGPEVSVRARLIAVLLCTILGFAAAGCAPVRRGGSGVPPAGQFARDLPSGSTVDEVASADLDGDGRDEALVAATIPTQGASQLTALVFTADRRGAYTSVLRRRLRGDRWLPILVGRAGEGAPLAAVFSAQASREGSLAYLVVQRHGRTVAVTLEHTNLPHGRLRFVPEGLLESSGDTDRILRWADATWHREDLSSQYLPPLPADTITIAYTVDAIRGAMTETPRVVRARVGQHLFLRRMDRGDPSRVQVVGVDSSFTIRPDGIIVLRHPDTLEIHIESPAHSGRTLVLSVRVEP
jgi:hypothetical protein